VILQEIYLHNFRCFRSLKVELHPQLTVFVAKNGAGKTAVLDAIALGFGRYFSKLPGVSGISTKDSDLRIESDERRSPFLALGWRAITKEGSSLVWAGGRRRNSATNPLAMRQAAEQAFGESVSGLRDIDAYTSQLVKASSENEPFFLPVIAYYGTNRALIEEVKRRRGFRKEFTRFDALSGALQSSARFKAGFEWFNAMEDLERRSKESKKDFDLRLPQLQAVRQAIVRMLPPGFSNPRTEIRPLRFVIDRKTSDGITRTLRISQLSDGFRVMLGLVMDLSRRMVQANSSMAIGGMEIANPLDLPAIALIDEVDLHLHPDWQQSVLPDLMKTFKKTQFIVTTHSPQVLSSIKRESIRVIDLDATGQDVAVQPLSMTYGEPSGAVLHGVMHVDPQPPVKEKTALQRLTLLVDRGEYQSTEAQNLLQELIAALGPLHPQIQRVQRSINRQIALG